MMKTKRFLAIIALILVAVLSLSSCDALPDFLGSIFTPENNAPAYVNNLDDIPEFSGDSYVIVNNNVPFFEEGEIVNEAYEFYSELDTLGRCGYAMACLSQELMPKEGEERGDINSVTPSGWNQAKYDIVESGWLYNRSHLIGWQLTAENANRKNLITGTRFMNSPGMLYYENEVADYIKETNYHVMYRVTPIYKGTNLVASGVLMEAWSVEDNGDGVCFNVYVYNNQPGIRINYADGSSKLDDGVPFPDSSGDVIIPDGDGDVTYRINTATGKFHKTTCTNANSSNCVDSYLTYEELVAEEYTPCGTCLKS